MSFTWVWDGAPAEIKFGAVIAFNMRSDGNNVDYFSESLISIFNKKNSDWWTVTFAPPLSIRHSVHSACRVVWRRSYYSSYALMCNF